MVGLEPALQAVRRLGHFEDLLAVVHQTAAASAQPGLFHLQVDRSEKHSHRLIVNAPRIRADGQAEQIGRRSLRLNLTSEDSVQQGYRHNFWQEAGPHEFEVDTMGKIAQPPAEGDVEPIQTMDEEHRIPWQLP